MTTQTAVETCRITFNVTTRLALPAGEQIFLSGDTDALGAWAPDGLPLSRVEDHVWTGSVELPVGQEIAFKVTRGTWGSEQILGDDAVPGDHKFTAKQDETIEISVPYWKDHFPEPPPQITGNYDMHYGVKSEFLRYSRRVIVWLPPSYGTESGKRYPVLYMHDGQQVFDPQTSTWGKAWGVDDLCTELVADGKLKEIIVVAIYSTDDRELEYDPSKMGHHYCRFIIEELKPFIDTEYRTLPGAKTTAVAGASFGGLISFHLAWSYPEVFSGAACLSPVFRYQGSEYALDAVRKARKAPSIRVFLHCGNGDKLEQELMPGMRDMAALLRAKKFKDHKNLLIIERPKGEHNEEAWSEVMSEWLTFLFGK